MPNRAPPVTDEISGQLAVAAQHLEARRYEDAHRLCLDVLKAAPATGEAFQLLAVIAADHANHARATDLLDKAIANGAGAARSLALKARSLIALNRRAEAISAAEDSAALAPKDAFTLDTLGVTFSRAGLHGRAPDFYRRAAAVGGTAGQYYNLGASLQFLGAFDDARAAYRACLARDPHHARAWSSLTQITRATTDSNDIPALTAAFEARQHDSDDTLNLGHALAKAHEDLGDPPAAMDWLAKAKASKRAAQPYDPDFDDRLFAAATRSAILPSSRGFTGAAPIFIVGMPRTGTTLIDRILSSHSQVTSAGELTDFALAMKRMTASSGPYVLDDATLDNAPLLDPTQLGEAYIASVHSTLGLAGRFTDKMPLNFFLAPHILRALPNARIICLRRNPADTVLANYRQLFATSFSYYAYANALESTADYFVKFDTLMKRFSEMLPKDRFCEVRYEEVVEDFEPQVRRLLDFCDLPFEPACLDFHENVAPVATASAAQVRQPLYRSALNRWKRYRPALDSALDILAAAGLHRQ
ncbi:MAG: sulfotransferase [Hyphomonadaceae bacterium]|nr:sulfotransferase [Hyphomonadaceae bacterium]